VTLHETETAYWVASWWLAHGDASLPSLAVTCFVLALLVASVLWAIRGAKLAVLLTALVASAEWWNRGGRVRTRHSDLYQQTMRSPDWRRRRRGALRRARFRCQSCGVRGPLEAHHLTYTHLGRELPGDLLAVCRACHARLHDG
jgi:hypothetical protein